MDFFCVQGSIHNSQVDIFIYLFLTIDHKNIPNQIRWLGSTDHFYETLQYFAR